MLLRFLDLARPPRLVKKRFERAVEAKDHEPPLVGHGLYPITPLDARWLGRAEVDRR